MATVVEDAVLVLPEWFDDRAAFETPSRGYLEGQASGWPTAHATPSSSTIPSGSGKTWRNSPA